jgi:hypothetical protein
VRAFLIPALALTLSASLASPAAAKYPSVPKELHGVWMNDDAAGQAQCRDYTAALGKGLDAARNYLVGAEVITRKIVHSYSEYGEGNFYQPTAIRSIGKQEWRLKTRVGFDQMPGGEHTGSAEFRLALRSGKLNWVNVSFDGEPSASQDSIALFRCAPIPAELYAG